MFRKSSYIGSSADGTRRIVRGRIHLFRSYSLSVSLTHIFWCSPFSRSRVFANLLTCACALIHTDNLMHADSLTPLFLHRFRFGRSFTFGKWKAVIRTRKFGNTLADVVFHIDTRKKQSFRGPVLDYSSFLSASRMAGRPTGSLQCFRTFSTFQRTLTLDFAHELAKQSRRKIELGLKNKSLRWVIQKFAALGEKFGNLSF